MDMLINIIYQFMNLIKNLLVMNGLDTSKLDEIMGSLKPEDEEATE